MSSSKTSCRLDLGFAATIVMVAFVVLACGGGLIWLFQGHEELLEVKSKTWVREHHIYRCTTMVERGDYVPRSGRYMSEEEVFVGFKEVDTGFGTIHLPDYEIEYTYEIERWGLSRIQQATGGAADEPHWPESILAVGDGAYGNGQEAIWRTAESYILNLVDVETKEPREIALSQQEWAEIAVGSVVRARVSRWGGVREITPAEAF